MASADVMAITKWSIFSHPTSARSTTLEWFYSRRQLFAKAAIAIFVVREELGSD
jgi:hypothetical protein